MNFLIHAHCSIQNKPVLKGIIVRNDVEPDLLLEENVLRHEINSMQQISFHCFFFASCISCGKNQAFLILVMYKNASERRILTFELVTALRFNFYTSFMA